MYAKLQDQMRNRRYYPALKTLEQLEHTYLRRIKRFRFAEIMKNSIPVFRDKIKEASMADLRVSTNINFNYYWLNLNWPVRVKLLLNILPEAWCILGTIHWLQLFLLATVDVPQANN